MNTDSERQHWAALKEIFQAASALPPRDRAALLDARCAGDAALRAEVERLLAANDQTDGFLETPPRADPGSAVESNLVGRTLGAYQLTALLGAGGMGEVYKARDTRLGRSVAVKVIRRHAAADRQSRERFEREARAIAGVTHPNICTLHDVGRDGDIDFIVMEYLEGETLAERIRRGPLPLDQALRHAIDIVSALDRAHSAGIVHRDLKPGNVILTKSGAKLLDFGLAKAVSTSPEGDRETHELTTPGLVVGTVQYMAPEQIQAKTIDARTDLFSCGAVLYEMFTGRTAFSGASQHALIGSILSETPPPMSAVRAEVPRSLDRVVSTCLAKDPDDRWQTARDLLRELKWLAQGSADAPALPELTAGDTSPGRRRIPVAAALAVALLAAGGAAGWWSSRSARTAAPTAPVVRFEIATSPNSDALSLALSPDGKRLAFVAQSQGSQQILVRALDQFEAVAVRGTEGATFPFWSPDGRSLGFFADGKLKRVSVEGGDPVVLSAAPSARGGSWGSAGILFAPTTASDIRLVPATGGNAVSVTKIEAGQNSHRWPQFIDDRRFLFHSVQAINPGLFIASLDSGATSRVLSDEEAAVFVAPDTLLVERGGGLVALRFDATRGVVSGEPRPIVPVVGVDPTFVRSAFSSVQGALAYRTTTAERRQLVWVDRAGTVLGAVGSADDDAPGGPELTADGRRLLEHRTREGNTDVWLLDVASGARRRFTFDDRYDFLAVWSPDARRVVFSTVRAGTLFQKATEGDESERAIVTSPAAKVPNSFSPDGRYLVYSEQVPKTGVDIWAVAFNEPDARPVPLRATVFDEMAAQVSPDGRWLAYQSNESGRMEVHIRRFMADGAERQVSPNGGTQPRWAPDGRELFYVAPDGALMAVSVGSSSGDPASLDTGSPRRLFQAALATGVGVYPAVGTRAQYVVGPDGRFLLNRPVADAPAAPIFVVLNSPLR